MGSSLTTPTILQGKHIDEYQVQGVAGCDPERGCPERSARYPTVANSVESVWRLAAPAVDTLIVGPNSAYHRLLAPLD